MVDVQIHNLLIRGALALALIGSMLPTASAAAAVERARDWLVRQQRDDGAIADQANPLFETWETVIAARALALSTAPGHRAATTRAMAFLERNANAQGLVCHNRRCREATCIETSAEYLQLLIDVGKHRRARALWSALIASQQPDGRFVVGNPDVRERLDFASVTAFVLAVAVRLELQDASVKRARAWLLSQQGARGDFGSAWEYYGSAAYALWPVSRSLHARQSAAMRSAQQRWIGFASDSQMRDGSWQLAQGERHISVALDTAMMLLALRNVQGAATVIAGAREALLAMQHADGHFDGGFFPIPSASYEKREDVFATAIAVLALQQEHASR